MIKLIVGKKGKGKTKCLLENVNEAVKSAEGNVVFVDKNKKHMFELDKKVRLINITEFPVKNADAFVGFICGIVSQDHDLEQVYIDAFLKTAYLEEKDIAMIENVIEELDALSTGYDVDICISLSLDETEVPETLKEKILIAL